MSTAEKTQTIAITGQSTLKTLSVSWEELNCKRAQLHLFLSHSLFFWEGHGVNSPRLEITLCFQQSHIVLLAPCQEGVKKGRNCILIYWSLDDLWAAF